MAIKNIGTEACPNYLIRVGVRRTDGRGMVCRERRGITNLRDAKRIERELYEQSLAIAKGYTHDTRWPAVVERYLTDAEVVGRLSPSTLQQYGTHLRAYTLSVWGHKDINDISTCDVLTLIGSNAKQFAWKMSHQKFIKKTISVVFGFACKNGLCRHNPCHAIRIRTEERPLTIWNQGQVKKFLRLAKESNSEWHSHWLVALHTGLRNSELRSLRWSSIDFEAKVIRVVEAWSPKSGPKAPKSRKARSVPINSALEDHLRELRAKSPFTTDGYVLPRLTSWNNGEQSKILRKFIKQTDLPQINFHTLRAVFASQCLLSGMALTQLMQICGWSSLESAERYLRISGADIAGSTDSLDFIDENATQQGAVIPFRGRTSSRP